MEEKENLKKKNQTLNPLVDQGNSNHCITSFSFDNIIKKDN
jgi:hypothetical protein